MSVLTLPVCFSCFTIAEREREECGKRERWGWGAVGESENMGWGGGGGPRAQREIE